MIYQHNLKYYQTNLSLRDKFDHNTGKYSFKPLQAVVTDTKDPGHIGIVILPDQPYETIKDITDIIKIGPSWFIHPDLILTTIEMREYKLNQLDI